MLTLLPNFELTVCNPLRGGGNWATAHFETVAAAAASLNKCTQIFFLGLIFGGMLNWQSKEVFAMM
jgi:hypothetical protein